jgi:hypothetical protein
MTRSAFIIIFTIASSAPPALLAGGRDSTASVQPNPWSAEVAMTYRHFQQQVKAEVGDPRGERLVNETEFGLMLLGSRQVWGPVSAGVYLQFDRGNRHAARYDRIDPATGRTVTKDKIGGDFRELWAGPFVKAQWRAVFLEFGYGLFGSREDDARTDLPSASGNTTDSFSLLPSVAWMMNVGGTIPLFDQLDFVARMEYRARYYDKRGGEAFKDDIEHGTQSWSPFVGIAWRF